jgi:hypothetical protein
MMHGSISVLHSASDWALSMKLKQIQWFKLIPGDTGRTAAGAAPFAVAIMPLLSTASDKSLLQQAEAVEIRASLAYYPRPESARRAWQRRSADPRSSVNNRRGIRRSAACKRNGNETY